MLPLDGTVGAAKDILEWKELNVSIFCHYLATYVAKSNISTSFRAAYISYT